MYKDILVTVDLDHDLSWKKPFRSRSGKPRHSVRAFMS